MAVRFANWLEGREESKKRKRRYQKEQILRGYIKWNKIQTENKIKVLAGRSATKQRNSYSFFLRKTLEMKPMFYNSMRHIPIHLLAMPQKEQHLDSLASILSQHGTQGSHGTFMFELLCTLCILGPAYIRITAVGAQVWGRSTHIICVPGHKRRHSSRQQCGFWWICWKEQQIWGRNGWGGGGSSRSPGVQGQESGGSDNCQDLSMNTYYVAYYGCFLIVVSHFIGIIYLM